MAGAPRSPPLPPGDVDPPLDELERRNRETLAELFRRHGPIFKAMTWGHLRICVLGLDRGRRLLREHGEAMTVDTVDIRALVPEGFLRAMHGETHGRVRRALVAAIDGDALFADCRSLEAMTRTALHRFAADGDGSAKSWRDAASTVATGMLSHLFYGAPWPSPRLDALTEAHREMGPFGFALSIGPRQHAGFARLRELVSSETPPARSPAVAHVAARAGALDAALLGNLVYMVEMGREDLAGLLTWLARHLCAAPDLVDDLAAEAAAVPAGARRPLAEAVVREVLRLDKSERLDRIVDRDFTFEGFRFPEGARVRVCLRESHHDPAVFPRPFDFEPRRFLDGGPPPDAFAPFGLDRHRCPLGDLSIRAGALFLGVLAADWTLEAVEDADPVRGAYHWQPSRRFAPRLRPR